jgi:hypothetical protein
MSPILCPTLADPFRAQSRMHALTAECFVHLCQDLVRAQPRCMVVNRGSHDQFVCARKRSSPVRIVSGEPTKEQANILDACSFSTPDQYASMSSIGGGSWPRVPRIKFVKCCWAEVNSRRASASLSAAITFTPTMA